ncbi:MAG TPA: TadA family conjugal transfer-associated ATPase [Mycobacteriales bacterium]|nr:TadA family conjugal transfer-associated ATPase [Mycobacteriales bacterium]
MTEQGWGEGAELVGRVRRRLATSAGQYDPAAIAAAVRVEAPTAGLATLLDVSDRLSAELAGAGVLAPLLAQPGVTDVLVNGPGPVWVDAGSGPRQTGLVIEDETAVRRLAVRLVAAAGRRLDDAAPYADARLADGTRVHAVLPPLAPDGTCISLRVPPRQVFTIDQLVAAGSVPDAGAELLHGLIDRRLAFLVTGGTGCGKTTVLSSLLSLVAREERIVLVEDAAELRPDHPHVVRLESRPANAEGAGQVTLDVLVRQALRMRPDRLVVGEVRGGEVLDLLAALNTGHEGGCSTVHANRAEHLPARIESLCGQAGVSRAAAHSLLAAAVDVVLHLTRGRDGRRRMAGLAVLVAGADGMATVTPAYVFDATGVRRGPAAAALDERMSAR